MLAVLTNKKWGQENQPEAPGPASLEYTAQWLRKILSQQGGRLGTSADLFSELYIGTPQHTQK